MLLVEISDDMEAFGSAEKLVSWAGICPSNHESAGKRVAGKKRKGNSCVQRILSEAASRTRCAFQEKFKSLLVGRGRKRAICAGSQNIENHFRIALAGDYYRDAIANYEKLIVERNAPS
uniref:Transposase IS116/IS110/IS902 family protein n=1 Tax=Candidatus Kentrum sp. TC TaxID=2126339 RepID=A0A451AFW8_9GAMM|nr:MAG: Transposase IS116/IS110/IS902 family protein [Candidatus Kentron sp. TC]